MESSQSMDDEFVLCRTCTKPFNSTERLPKILQCLHVICLSCIESLSKGGKLSCSRCKETTEIGPNGGKKLLTDPSRLRMKQPVDSIPCQDCPDSANADYYCQHCNDFYCKECRDLHLNKRNRSTKDHTVICLTAVTPELLQAFKQPQQCPKHNQPRIFFCNKTDCNVAICVSCTVSDHKEAAGHSVCNLSEAYHKKKQDITQRTKVIQNELSKVQKAIEKEEKNINNLEKLKIGVMKEIEDEFLYLSRLISDRRDNLIKDTAEKYVKMKEELIKQIQEMKLEEERSTAALTFKEKSMSDCSETEFIALAGVVQKRLNVLSKEWMSQQPVNGYNLRYQQKISTELLKALSTSDDCIESQILRLDLSEVTTSGAIQNTRSEIAKIVLKNQQLVADLVNIESVEANVTDLNGKKTTCEVVQNAADKTMTVYLSAPTSGKYYLTINVLGQPLQGGKAIPIAVEKEQDSEDGIASDALAESFTAGSNCDVSSINCPQFAIDNRTVHESLEIRDDDKTLRYDGRGLRTSRGTKQLKKYRGGKGTMCFDRNTTGKVYYQVNGNASFEIGLCREESIDKSDTVHQQPHSVSLTVVACEEHWGVCRKVWKSGKLISHNEVSGCFTIGFLLDSHKRTFSVVDCKKDEVLTVVNDVNLDQPLWPVFGFIDLYVGSMTLIQGRDIVNIPKCIKC